MCPLNVEFEINLTKLKQVFQSTNYVYLTSQLIIVLYYYCALLVNYCALLVMTVLLNYCQQGLLLEHL